MSDDNNVIQFSLDGVEQKEDKAIEIASRCIRFLNEKSGQNFLARNPKGVPTASANIIIDRLNEGYTEQQDRDWETSAWCPAL